jgi:orotate phosphoribosyltransferase
MPLWAIAEPRTCSFVTSSGLCLRSRIFSNLREVSAEPFVAVEIAHGISGSCLRSEPGTNAIFFAALAGQLAAATMATA